MPSSLSQLDALQENKLNTVNANFNGRNDRIATPITSPVVATGTGVTNVINTDGSANVAVEWSWTGTNSEIDGFTVIVHSGDPLIGRSPTESIVRDLFF